MDFIADSCHKPKSLMPFPALKPFVVRCFYLALIVGAQSVHAWNAATPSVPIEDEVYATLDILESHGLVTETIAGHKPYTRAEIARLAESAKREFNRHQSPDAANGTAPKAAFKDKTAVFLRRLLDELSTRFPAHLNAKQFHPHINALEEAAVKITALDPSPRAYFPGGNIDAVYNPLTEHQAGRHYASGMQADFETIHSAFFAPYASLYLQPRLQLQFVNTGGDEEYAPFLQEGYITAGLFNTQFDIGRKPMNWGQTRYGGIMFTNNARAMDSIQLTNPEPWKIKFLGLLKYTFFYSALGPEYNLPYAQMTGGKITVKPWPFLELGVARAIIFGGDGSPPATAWDIFKEFFGARNAREFAAGGGPNLSNSISGVEWRARLPFLRGIGIYNELYFDDFDPGDLFRSSLQQDTGILFGIHVPRLDDSGTLGIRIEGRRNSSILYHHGGWPSGWTLNGFVMGDPLGSDAESLTIRVDKTLPNRRAAFFGEFTIERIDSDTYELRSNGRFKVADGIAETRFRPVAGASYRFNKLFSGAATVGYEHVSNFGFATGATADNFILQAQLRYEPGGLFRVPR